MTAFPEPEQVVARLAAIDRPSASLGERQAAEYVRDRLTDLGLRAGVEQERAHGGYWWPLGLLSAAAGLAGLGRSRALALAVASAAALGIREELEVRGRLWTRRLLPKRPTWNVVGEAGERDADHTVVVVSHHDAAHAGAVFRPALVGLPAVRWLVRRSRASPPLMWLVFANPLVVAAGALLGRRALQVQGALGALASALSFADIGARRVVPGANDNLSGVAALLEIARALVRRPVDGVRVLLVSTGSEESFEEGMLAFAARHADDLDASRTTMVVLDTVGSPHLLMLEGEGMLMAQPYDAALKDLLADCAREQGIDLRRGHRLTFGSDALVGVRRGIPTVLIGSCDDHWMPTNYHWYSDTAENVDYGTVRDAARLTETAIRRIAAGQASERA